MRSLHWLFHEAKAIFFAALFFGSCFFVVMILKKLLLEEYDIAFGNSLSALMLALVTAKVVVIFEKVSFGARSGLIEVLLRTAAYSFAAFLFLLLEHGLSKRAEAGGFIAALTQAWQHAEAPRILATLICVTLAFVAYTAFAILRRELGAGRVAAVFLEKPPVR